MYRKLFTAILIIITSQTSLFSFGKNKVNDENINWKILTTLHFDIYYPDDMEETAIEAAKISEQGYVHISNYLKHELTDIIPIILYPSHISFQNNNILPTSIDERTGGFTEVLKNRVVIPFTGSFYELRHVLTHELVHAFQFNILFSDTSGRIMSKFFMGSIPLWVFEGMAEYLSIGYDSTADMVMRDALFNEKYASLMDLTDMNINNIYLLYKEGQAVFYFLEMRYGKDIIGEMLRDLRDVRDLKKVIESSTGKTIEKLNDEWIRFYKKRYFSLVKNKNFEDEEGKQITDHEKTFSSINTAPAVSPDGKKIAYITNRDIYSNLVIASVDKKKDKKIKTVIKGNNSAQFEGMHLMSNNLTWTRDGKSIVFVAQGYNSDIIYIIDSHNGRIKSEIKLPFRSIMDPSLSFDGTIIAFTGAANGATDIYIYDLKLKKLSMVTNDGFMDRYPRISPDNKTIIFSSNWNSEGKYDKNTYSIYTLDIVSGKRNCIIENNGSNLQADISKEGDKLIYISNKTGIYNAYIYNLHTKKSEKVTDVLSGLFYPKWFPDSENIVFVGYQNQGYDIFIKNIKKSERYTDTTLDTQYKSVSYPDAYVKPSHYIFHDYYTTISPDIFSFGAVGTINDGILGFVQISLSDYLGNNRLILTTNYVHQNKNNDFNFDMAYYYLKYRWDLGIGAFRQKNPFWIYSLSDIDDLIHNVNYSTLYMNHYGVYGTASYPFSRFFRFDIMGSFSRYERDYSITDKRRDVYANLNKVSFFFCYDNVLWSGLSPISGTRAKIGFEQSFNVSGHDYIFSNFNFDMRKYFLLKKRYVFALKGSGGTIFGKNSNYFKYYIGGYNTLRGHPLFEYGGKNMLLFNGEFRFTFIEGIKMGWPLFFGIGNIGGVLFYDMGSAWNGNSVINNIKTDIGCGLRLAIYPIIILKLDFAWPYIKRSFRKGDVIFSLGYEY